MTVLECGGWKVNIKLIGWVQAENPAKLSNHLVKADLVCKNQSVSFKGITVLNSQIQYIGMVGINEFMFNALIARSEKNKTQLTLQHNVQLRDARNFVIFQSRDESALLSGQRKTLLENKNCQFYVQILK